ncbi:hypothetical protein BU17DRAFT_65561 [Hysterangium stoloniferum]|nr:hypothetical protein BU17DRAFT_65561 [Hysterangium stoloniferum]
MSTVSQTKTKKAASTRTKASAAKSKTAAAKGIAHPPFADIIKECIIDAGDRSGVSRITIKKFAEEKYKLQPTPTVISNINRSIAYGAEKGVFVLPKGPSGKVKLAPKRSSSDAAKENAKPVKPAAPTKAVKKAAAPKAATTKAALKPSKPAKKAAVKKTTKPPAAKKKSVKRSPAKKSATGTAKPKATVKGKAPSKKKTTSTASKRKSASPAKPASKAAAKPTSKK